MISFFKGKKHYGIHLLKLETIWRTPNHVCDLYINQKNIYEIFY